MNVVYVPVNVNYVRVNVNYVRVNLIYVRGNVTRVRNTTKVYPGQRGASSSPCETRPWRHAVSLTDECDTLTLT